MFDQVEVSSLECNPFSMIGNEYFLVTAGNYASWNTMTAAWGSMGVMWGRQTFSVVVRDSRYTYEFLNKSEGFTCSFFSPDYKDILSFCGTHSGRDTDKSAQTGLIPLSVESSGGIELVTFEQANMVFCCRIASKTPISPDHFLLADIERHYPKKDYHTLYIGFIDRLLVKEA